MRITVVLAVLSNGEKVIPLVISKGKNSEIDKKYGFWGGVPNQSSGQSMYSESTASIGLYFSF